MTSLDFILRVKTEALKNGLNPADYDPDTIALRERNALRLGKTRAEFMTDLLLEVKRGKK